MARRNIILLFLFILISSLCLYSCAKKEAPATPFGKLQGKWKYAKFGSDDNKNGLIDAFEMHPVAASMDHELVFNKDGSGVETDIDSGKTTILNFKWILRQYDSLWVEYDANDTFQYYLANLSSQDLTMTEQGKVTIEWSYYVRK